MQHRLALIREFLINHFRNKIQPFKLLVTIQGLIMRGLGSRVERCRSEVGSPFHEASKLFIVVSAGSLRWTPSFGLELGFGRSFCLPVTEMQ